jgi:hypothetical protein
LTTSCYPHARKWQEPAPARIGMTGNPGSHATALLGRDFRRARHQWRPCAGQPILLHQPRPRFSCFFQRSAIIDSITPLCVVRSCWHCSLHLASPSCC